MKTSVVEVHDMLSVWSVEEVEKRIGKVPGVESVTVNYAGGSATVRYDETRLEVADIKSAVRQSGYESAAPKAPPDAPVTTGVASAGTAQQDKAVPDAAPSTTSKSSPVAPDAAPEPMSAEPKSAQDAAPAGDEQQDKDRS